MQHRKKVEFVHPIIIWIIASILFHLLLMLGIITLRINSINLPEPRTKDHAQDRALLMMDEPAQRPIPSKPVTQAMQPKAQQKQQEIKQAQPKVDPLAFTMVPGRKGMDKQDIDDPAKLQNLPTPESQKLTKTDKPQPITPPQQNLKTENDTTSKTVEKTVTATQFLDQTGTAVAAPKERSTPIHQQDPYQFVPQPNRTISFKDLNLGFDERYKTIGNNQHLINQGTSLAAPDGIALKHLTYYNQCAGMMKQAFATHPHVRLRPHATGKRFHFSVTVNRQGKNLNVAVRAGSGDEILDRIIEESVRSVNLFPKVPNFIQEDPFTMNWTFLH